METGGEKPPRNRHRFHHRNRIRHGGAGESHEEGNKAIRRHEAGVRTQQKTGRGGEDGEDGGLEI